MSSAEAPLVQLEDVDLMNHYSDDDTTTTLDKTANQQQLTTEVEVSFQKKKKYNKTYSNIIKRKQK